MNSAQRASFAGQLRRLLGRAAPVPLTDRVEVERIARELRATHDDATGNDWGLVSRAWGPDTESVLTDTLHQLASNVGERPVWVVSPGADAEVVALGSDVALDNPLGLAAVLGHQLALLDQEVPGGLWLVGRSDPSTIGAPSRWELDVWGEPWTSAATRAFRHVG